MVKAYLRWFTLSALNIGDYSMWLKKIFKRKRLRRWKYVDFSEANWLNLTARELFLIDKIEPRVFHKFNQTISVTCISDYSGAQKDSKFNTYSFLFIREKAIRKWSKNLKKVRKKLKIDDRSISYKSLNDNVKARLLRLFLENAEKLNGAVITFAIHKDFQDFTVSQKNTKKLKN